MDDLAVKLNETLKGTCAYDMLSDYGLRMYVPKGIIVQAADAKEKAKKYNATIGVALDHGSAMFFPAMKAQFADTLKVSEIFPYAPMGGVMALRKAWKEDMYRKNPLLEGKTTSLPVVTSGLTNALSLVCSLFLENGGDVIVPDMYWENYNLILDEQRQANKIMFPIFKGAGFNVEGLDYALTSADDCVMVILNFPNNPTGYTPTDRESDEIIAVLKKHADAGKKIALVCDDAYFGLFFDDGPCRQSLFAKAVGLSPNILAVKCDAATKEEMVWGFRVAFVTYGGTDLSEAQLDALVQKTMGALRGSLSSCSMPGQNIVLKGIEDPNHESDKAKGVKTIGERYLKMKEALKKYAGNDALRPLPFNSGYFMTFWCKPNAEELRKYLLDNYQTGIIRNDEHHIRLAFSSVDLENIEGLIDTVYKAAGELS